MVRCLLRLVGGIVAGFLCAIVGLFVRRLPCWCSCFVCAACCTTCCATVCTVGYISVRRVLLCVVVVAVPRVCPRWLPLPVCVGPGWRGAVGVGGGVPPGGVWGWSMRVGMCARGVLPGGVIVRGGAVGSGRGGCLLSLPGGRVSCSRFCYRWNSSQIRGRRTFPRMLGMGARSSLRLRRRFCGGFSLYSPSYIGAAGHTRWVLPPRVVRLQSGARDPNGCWA